MSTMKIKKGDTVKVIAGKDLGTEGKVLSVDVDVYKRQLTKVRKGGDFFYGKSGNENYIESL